jgi:hypothetical protein
MIYEGLTELPKLRGHMEVSEVERAVLAEPRIVLGNIPLTHHLLVVGLV